MEGKKRRQLPYTFKSNFNQHWTGHLHLYFSGHTLHSKLYNAVGKKVGLLWGKWTVLIIYIYIYMCVYEPYEVSSAFIKHASFSCENNSTSPPTLLFLQSSASNLTRFTFLTHTWHLNGPIAVGLSCFVYTLVVLSMTPLWFPKFTPFSRWSTLLLEH